MYMLMERGLGLSRMIDEAAKRVLMKDNNKANWGNVCNSGISLFIVSRRPNGNHNLRVMQPAQADEDEPGDTVCNKNKLMRMSRIVLMCNKHMLMRMSRVVLMCNKYNLMRMSRVVLMCNKYKHINIYVQVLQRV